MTSADLTSADGALTLHVESAQAGLVTVEALDPTGFDFGDDIEVLAAFDFGPSGTELDAPAEMTFDTGLTIEDHQPIPMYTVLLTDDGETWEALTPIDISIDDGSVSVSAAVPHFSRLVINRGDLGVWLEPIGIDTIVGAEWDAYFDIYDKQFAHITNEPARRGIVFDEVFGDVFTGRIRAVREQTDFGAEPVATGVVEPVADDRGVVGTYDFLPASGAPLSLREPMTFVEIFYGVHAFTCRSVGIGTFGFEADIVVNKSNIVFGARFDDGRLALIRPSDGVRFHYEVSGPARCRDLYGRAGSLLNGFYGVPLPQVDTLLTNGVREDGMSDGIYSMSRVLPGVFTRAVDLWDVIPTQIETRFYRDDWITNFSVFECGETAEVREMGGQVTTVCAPDVVDIDGDLVVVAAIYSDDLPGPGATDHYTYAAVFESNDDPTDDWQFQGQFDWDYFIGTDRWYQIHWDPDAQTWSMTVTNALEAGGPSGARALIAGDTVIWLIPKSEFPAPIPEVRVTSFIHDGSFRPEVSGGDVSGADPTEPLIPVTPLG